MEENSNQLKTYKVQHFLFGLRWQPNPLKIDFKTTLIILRQHFTVSLISSFGMRITKIYILNRIRYFNKSKKYAELNFYANNKDHNNVIKIFNQFSMEELDTQLITLVSKSYSHLNQGEKALELQKTILDNYSNRLPETKINFVNVLKKGAEQSGTLLELEDGSPINLIKAKNFQYHPVNNSIEHHFYLTFSNSSLEAYIPTYRSFTKIKNMGFLKLEYIHGRSPILADINQILKFQKELIKIKYSTLLSSKSIKPVLNFILSKSNGLPYSSKRKMSRSLSKISNYLNFKKMNEKNEYDIILEQVYLKPYIFQLINLKEDLALQHRDFGSGNIIVNFKGVPIVYDWNSYKLGLPGNDVLQFILGFTYDFDYIQTHLFDFLEKEKINNFHVVSSYLVLIYLNHLMNQPEGIRTQENLHKAMEYLTMSPLNS